MKKSSPDSHDEVGFVYCGVDEGITQVNRASSIRRELVPLEALLQADRVGGHCRVRGCLGWSLQKIDLVLMSRALQMQQSNSKRICAAPVFLSRWLELYVVMETIVCGYSVGTSSE